MALASCNTAGELPAGPVTPIVPPPGVAATRSAQPTSAPVASTAAVPMTVTLPVRLPVASDGESLYAARCAACHGATGKGDGPQSQQIVASIGGTLPNFADLAYARAVKPTDWFNAITVGRLEKGMPPFTSLTDDQRWDVVAYLYTLSIPQEQLEQGKAIYTDKCVACHGASGKADTPGAPDLADAARMIAKSQADLETIIVSGRGAMPGFATLSQSERRAVADYVRSLSMQLNPLAAPVTGRASIIGTVVNGTAGANAPGNLPVTLYALSPDGSAIMFTRTITSDASGQFVFDQLDGSAPILYGLQTQYLKATYTSDPLTFAHGGLTLTVPITVYETTTDASGLRVEQMHLFFEFLGPGSVTVGQLLIVSNLGDRAYLGADGVSARFPLPPGATDIRFPDGELGERFQPVSSGLADTEPVLPGTGSTQILVSYDLPYDGKRLDLALPMAYPVRSVIALVPEGGVKLASPQLTEAGTRATQGGNLVNYVGGNIAAGQTLMLQLSGAPRLAAAGESASGGPSAPPMLIISAALVLVAVSIVAVVWIRQQRRASELAGQEIEDWEAQREELLDALAALDDDFEAGRIPESDYRRQRAEWKAELIELMGRDEGQRAEDEGNP